ncbi:MAG TPA: molecular chaperone TorD family protein [Symbiobacteriaceae bacterium]|jgi:DMSO reductase family type II enzyme chaperone
MEIAEQSVAVARSRVYASLSRAFLYPMPGLVAQLKDGGFLEALQGELTPADGLAEVAAALAAVDLANLEPDYQSWFDAGQAVRSPLYETEYTASHVWMQTQQMADIAGFYRAFGVDVRDAGEKVDFLGTQLEFMSMLALKEAIATGDGDAPAADICREAQVKFLKEHLAVWLPRLESRVAQLEGEGFYPALVRLTARFVAGDCARVEGGEA